MTIEYVLLLIAGFAVGVKIFFTEPARAFKEGAPRLGSRIEKQLATGDGFRPKDTRVPWRGD
jgi:hypothetical protein